MIFKKNKIKNTLQRTEESNHTISMDSNQDKKYASSDFMSAAISFPFRVKNPSALTHFIAFIACIF